LWPVRSWFSGMGEVIGNQLARNFAALSAVAPIAASAGRRPHMPGDATFPNAPPICYCE
jgi:hypothetical protein